MRVVRSRWTCFARVLPAVVCAAAASLLGCSSSSLTSAGTPVVTMGNLTNSSDFASYTVLIDGITLTRSDGTAVTPLVTPETVDLVKLNSVTELVEAPAVPSGTYVSASITLDWTAASIWLNVDGKPVRATYTTPSGTPVAVVAVNVTFDPAHPLIVAHNQSVRLQVDIDVAASNSVTSFSSATVQVQPFATMTAAPVDSTVMRARGLFVVVPSGSSAPAGTSGVFVMNMRPFYDLTSALGAVNVNTNAKTYWNINGTAYTGSAGLSALASQQENTPIVADGTLDDLSGITPSFNATSVYVGISQESPLAEYLTGVVSARSGDTLTLLGVTYLTPIGGVAYLASTPVLIGSGTIISVDGNATQGLTAASISVGQQITVSGQANVDATTGALLGLDATAGQVRIAPTPVWGTLNSATAGSASLDVLSLGGFAPAGFNFAGTGAGGQDAMPAAYEVNTGSLDESAVAAGTLLQVQGNVTSFGAAPPDFTASSITPGTNTLQTLVIEWVNGGSAHPFRTINAAGLVVETNDPNLGTTHYIGTGPATLDLSTLPAYPVITTEGAGQNYLDLAVGSATLSSGVRVFDSASAFDDALSNTFEGTNKIFRLVAYGQYNSATNTFVASRIHVALQETT